MAFINTKSEFHIALDGVGLILQGSPDRPGYLLNGAPIYGTRFASGDRDYNDLSRWWYLIQTDWSGGVKETLSFADDAKYYYSTNIDSRTKPGSFRLETVLTQERDVNDGAGTDRVFECKGVAFGASISQVTAYNHNGTLRDITSGGAVGGGADCRSFIGHRGYLWVFGNSGVTNFQSTQSSKTSQIESAAGISISEAGVGVTLGNTLYNFGTTSTGNLYGVSTASANPSSSSDWASLFQLPLPMLGATVVGAEVIGGEIVILVEGSPYWIAYSFDISSSVATELQRFDGGVQLGVWSAGARYIAKHQQNLLFTIITNSTNRGIGQIWKYDGTALEKIFENDEIKMSLSTVESKQYLRGGAVVYGDYAFWGNLIYDGTHFYNWIKDYNDSTTYDVVPIGSDGNKLYVATNEIVSGDEQTYIYSYSKDETVFKSGASNSAFLVLNQHDKLQSIDKLMNTLTINFENLSSGQSIDVYYTDSPLPDPDISEWTSLGSASFSIDGGSVTSKKFTFPDGTIAKKMWFRIGLSSSVSGTPTVSDTILEYLPMPDLKKKWTVVINCGESVKRLNGRLAETTGRELKSRLEKMWLTKSGFDFQDLDFAQTTISNNPLTSSGTTITVPNASTADFPEQGRLHIEEEEILYTGKTPGSFTGCVRGINGTRAVAHAQGAVVHNGYKVMINDIQVQVPIILQDKMLEYNVQLSLLEL